MKDRGIEKFHEVLEATKQCRSWKEKREKFLEFGFEFYDDENGSEEEIAEEKSARPQNERQKRLVTYLDSDGSPTKTLIEDFLTEKDSDETNYPLFRRYFRKGDPQLKKLILFGLDIDPTSMTLLNDLSFFSYFSIKVSEFIKYYTRACVDVEDLNEFRQIVENFEHVVIEYDYDAYVALLQRDDINERKKSIVKELLEKHDEGISF